jgi:hypothetical protein
METTMCKLLTFLIALAAIALGVCTPIPAQMMMMGAGCGGASCGGGGGTTLTYTATDLTQGFGSTSYSSVNIGPVAADRVIVITAFVSSTSQAGCQNAGAAPTVTVGGHTMSTVTQAGESTGGQCQYIYYLFAPSGVLNASTAAVASPGSASSTP